LARGGVSIEELQTATSSAPMSAETLFEASVILVVTGDVDVDELSAELEAIANELMVDIDLTT
jgi:glycine cleavage system regulatory protein